MLMIEEVETVIAPLSEGATDFWNGFLLGGLIATAILCGGA